LNAFAARSRRSLPAEQEALLATETILPLGYYVYKAADVRAEQHRHGGGTVLSHGTRAREERGFNLDLPP